jgi:hypothetical protein
MIPEIFDGKDAQNNEVILKALFENGYLSPWQIANEIATHSKKKMNGDLYHRKQKINSILTRKNGRLQDLLRKEFIEKTERDYCLTFNKGFCSALTFYSEIPKPAIDEATKVAAFLPELREMLDAMIRFQPQAQIEGYKIMQTITNDLLDMGLNFEKISNDQFNRFYSEQFEERQLEELKKAEKTGKKRELPSDLMEATNKFVSRLLGMAQKEIKGLEELRDRNFQDNHEGDKQEK